MPTKKSLQDISVKRAATLPGFFSEPRHDIGRPIQLNGHKTSPTSIIYNQTTHGVRVGGY